MNEWFLMNLNIIFLFSKYNCIYFFHVANILLLNAHFIEYLCMINSFFFFFFFGLNCTKNISIVHVCHDCFAGCLKVLGPISSLHKIV